MNDLSLGRRKYKARLAANPHTATPIFELMIVSPAFYQKYIDRVPGDALQQLRVQQPKTLAFLRKLSEEQWAYSYGPGKWTLYQSWRHVLDSERIFATRALCFLRGEKQPLPGFDQDAYADRTPMTGNITMLLAEYDALRSANILCLSGYSAEAYDKVGIASDCKINTRALLHIIGGHELHHLELTRTRYLGQQG